MGDVLFSIKNVHKQFVSNGTNVKALENVNLDIYKGEIFGIIGMSGAGKSTLVRCMNMLEKPTEGRVVFDETDLCKLGSNELRLQRQKIGMIFQQFNLMEQRTSLENVCFPMEIKGEKKEERIKRASELLELVGLSQKLNAYPSQLSGGQKQRVAIARALATNPKALLCDEATSALDPDTTQSILMLLKDINARLGITVIIITHEMAVIESICHRVCILDNSKVVECEDVVKFFSAPKSDAGKKLIYPTSKQASAHKIGERCCRIVFNGEKTSKPIIANMVLSCNAPVNILFADTKDIDGKTFGEMVVGLPNDENACGKIISFLKDTGLTFEEVKAYD